MAAKQLVIMQIEYEPGKRDNIVVSVGDSPSILAAQFCAKHSLDNTVREFLIHQINSTL